LNLTDNNKYKMTKKVLIIDNTHPILKEKLEQNNFVCDNFEGTTLSELEEIIGNYNGAIIRSRFTFDKDLLDKSTNLEFIGRVGAGMESIDIEYAESKNIKCYNSPEGNRDAVGEHALGMLLLLMNKLNEANSQVSKGCWNREQNRGMEIKGRTVGIIGYGNMGGSFARKISGFGANVIAYDKYKKNYSDKYATEVSLETLLAESDIISLHVPLTDETKYMVNNDFFSKLSKPIFLINTARGPVVKTKDLVDAIKSGKILGAGLDVIEYEETSFEKVDLMQKADFRNLAELNNVTLSPHIAGWTVESKIKLAEVLADKIINNH